METIKEVRQASSDAIRIHSAAGTATGRRHVRRRSATVRRIVCLENKRPRSALDLPKGASTDIGVGPRTPSGARPERPPSEQLSECRNGSTRSCSRLSSVHMAAISPETWPPQSSKRKTPQSGACAQTATTGMNSTNGRKTMPNPTPHRTSDGPGDPTSQFSTRWEESSRTG